MAVRLRREAEEDWGPAREARGGSSPKRQSFALEFSLTVAFIVGSGTTRQNGRRMSRSRIEIYWNTADTAPDGVIAQVMVTDNSGSEYLLPYPCELTKEGWVNAASGKPLAVRVTYWKPYVETLPRKKPGKRIGSDGGRQNGD
jgi:hypothetical protein